MPIAPYVALPPMFIPTYHENIFKSIFKMTQTCSFQNTNTAVVIKLSKVFVFIICAWIAQNYHVLKYPFLRFKLDCIPI